MGYETPSLFETMQTAPKREKHTTVLASSRAIRARLLQLQDENRFLPHFLTMSDFLQRSMIVRGYRRIDEDERTLALLEASDFNAFASLQIERNFFTFTQNSSYIFRFFEELSGEAINIDALDLADTYGDYEEHILILQELYRRYEAYCEKHKILDRIFMPKQYELNSAYLKNLGAIEIVIEGYLTNFELSFLKKCAAITPISVSFYASSYNQKMQDKLQDLGFEVIFGQQNKFHLHTLTSESNPVVTNQANIEAFAFSERLLQVAFVKHKVYEFIKKGIAPEAIAVVLPDESFADYLKLFDSENNFNFAMGIPFSQSDIYGKLHAISEYLDAPSVQNSARLNRIGDENLTVMLQAFHSTMGEVNFSELLMPLIENEKIAEVKEIVEMELYYFEKLSEVLKDLPVKSAMHLFLNRLRAKSINDVRGGKVTVMGVLETRSVHFDGVVVVDFNESNVPRKSEKDLFLNSATRIKANLPSAHDRENLQKHYYHTLFLRAKEVAISYVHASDAVPSRFLMQLGIPTKSVNDNAYANIMMPVHHFEKKGVKAFVATYDFQAQPLSATGLKTFLECRRKFYYRYVEKLSNHDIPQDVPKEYEIGNVLHNALKKVYETTKSFEDIGHLRESVEKALKDVSGSSEFEKFLLRLWRQRLEPFYENEMQRFQANISVLECEQSYLTDFSGVTLTGRIDRIDITPEGIEVLDYKSGKYPLYTPKTIENATDFQLEFYYLLAQKKGKVINCGYYDLNKGIIVPENMLEEKLERLQEHLKVLTSSTTFNADLCEDIKQCQFCEFAFLCERV